jgi:hypothetical protein
MWHNQEFRSSPSNVDLGLVEPDGYAIAWSEEIELSEYELWNKGVSLTESEILMGDRIEQS